MPSAREYARGRKFIRRRWFRISRARSHAIAVMFRTCDATRQRRSALRSLFSSYDASSPQPLVNYSRITGSHVFEMKLTTEAQVSSLPKVSQRANKQTQCTVARCICGTGRYAVSRIRAATCHATSLTIHRRTETLRRWPCCRRRRRRGKYHAYCHPRCRRCR